MKSRIEYREPNNESRVTSHEPQTNKAFTLIELVVAVALLAMVLSFASVIFKVGIGAHRTAGANAEIMQKLRAITDQLNADFKGLQKDGYLLLHSEELADRREFDSSEPNVFCADRMYYFSTGDFQSWFAADVRSNIARVYFGHDGISLSDSSIPVRRWYLARDILLLTPGTSGPDYADISYAVFKTNVLTTLAYANSLFDPNTIPILIPIDIEFDPNDVRRLMCENVGEIVVEWTDGARDTNDSLAWFGLSTPRRLTDPNYITIEDITNWPYRASWTPETPRQYWPEALRFTFTLYDSRGILEEGRTFTHIVYLGN